MDEASNFDYNCHCHDCRKVMMILMCLQRMGIGSTVSEGPVFLIVAFLANE